jgi:acetyl-CoA/propionyl-CoA carboxylase biotin carboxyl carrier protein
VRLDAGFQQGDVIGGNFDSLLAKLIVTGATREEALERARRALDEFQIEGIATALSFHRVVVRDPAFATPDDVPFRVHTRWIETEFDNTIPAYTQAASEIAEPEERTSLTVEVAGKRLEVSLPAGLSLGGGHAAGPKKAPKRSAKKGGSAASGDAVAAPMQGTIVKVAVEEGQKVEAGELVVVLEAMKMEQPLNAHKAGVVTGLAAEVGATVPTGTVLLRSRTTCPALGFHSARVGEDGRMSTVRTPSAPAAATLALGSGSLSRLAGAAAAAARTPATITVSVAPTPSRR